MKPEDLSLPLQKAFFPEYTEGNVPQRESWREHLQRHNINKTFLNPQIWQESLQIKFIFII